MTQRTRVFLAANFFAAALVVISYQLPTRINGTALYVKPRIVPNPAKAPFVLTKLQNGAQLSGDTQIEVAVFSRYSNVSEIYLSINGKDHSSNTVYSNYPGPELHTEPTIIGLEVRSAEFSNGSHLLTISDERGHKQRRKVRFSNAIHSVDSEELTVTESGTTPDIYKGTIASEGTRHWVVAYKNEAGAKKVFAGKGQKIRVVFDGRGIINDSQIYSRNVQFGPTRNAALRKASLPSDTPVTVVP